MWAVHLTQFIHRLGFKKWTQRRLEGNKTLTKRFWEPVFNKDPLCKAATSRDNSPDVRRLTPDTGSEGDGDLP